jgi:hypothetical protein
MDPDKQVPPLAPPAPPSSARGGAAPSPPPPLAAGAGAATLPPVVLQVLPLCGSPAPIGYIYNATPDADGGLLAAALAFFTHQGHQVFHNPCPDLDEYLWAMSVLSPIIPVNPLPDHILLSGLELKEGIFTPLPTNSFGTAFMAAYLLSLWGAWRLPRSFQVVARCRPGAFPLAACYRQCGALVSPWGLLLSTWGV